MESIATFAEIHTRTLCIEMHPNWQTAQPDFCSRCCCNTYCLQTPNLDILAVFLLPNTVLTQHPPKFHPAPPLSLETFHPASTLYSTHIKLGHWSTSKAVVPYQTYARMILNVCIYHVGCWVEFHPASLSEWWLTRRQILPFQLSVNDMIHDDLGEYFTDSSKRNCFAEIWVDSTLSFMILHWDLRYDAYQHPCDLMVKPFEWQPKEQRQMQNWEKCIQITWTFNNFCSIESSICRQHILQQFLFSNTLDPWEYNLAKYW